MGREFVEIFDEWVETYDDSVSGKDEEYRDVFAGYDNILQKVADEARGLTIEFGIGTGNLTEKLLAKGLNVIGVEPNAAMRNKTQLRFPDLSVADGDFTNFPLPEQPVDTLVSTYAFHHLTDDEKKEAADYYAKILSANGQVVFADTMFKDDQARIAQWAKVEKQGYKNLLEDLKREYYTTMPIMRALFEEAGFAISFTPLNEYVWLIHAKKQERV